MNYAPNVVGLLGISYITSILSTVLLLSVSKMSVNIDRIVLNSTRSLPSRNSNSPLFKPKIEFKSSLKSLKLTNRYNKLV